MCGPSSLLFRARDCDDGDDDGYGDDDGGGDDHGDGHYDLKVVNVIHCFYYDDYCSYSLCLFELVHTDDCERDCYYNDEDSHPSCLCDLFNVKPVEPT